MNLADRLQNPAWRGELRPIVDDLEGDLIHDCFVPRYSRITEGRPKVIVLIGVWLLFLFTGLPGGIAIAPFEFAVAFGQAPRPSYWWLAVPIALLLAGIELALAGKVTWRFIRWRDRRRAAT